MQYTCAIYQSPIGALTLCDNGAGLCGLWLEGQRYFGMPIAKGTELNTYGTTPTLKKACTWLDEYFAGKAPSPTDLPLAPEGSDFQKAVWKELLAIPYGKTTTYGTIAKSLAVKIGRRVASIAVGGAVGHNPISVIVPCHRVVGANGSLTGYAGGLDRKIWLLKHEHVDMTHLFRPKTGTAL